jgi:excisionase family DNA binding protein
MPAPIKDLLTAREVAERIGVSLRTVWRWNAIGELPAPVRRGLRIVRWKATDIDRFVQQLPVQRSRLPANVVSAFGRPVP